MKLKHNTLLRSALLGVLALAPLTIAAAQEQPAKPATPPAAPAKDPNTSIPPADLDDQIKAMDKEARDEKTTEPRRQELLARIRSLKTGEAYKAPPMTPAHGKEGIQGMVDPKADTNNIAKVPAPVHPANSSLKFEHTLHDFGRISDESPVLHSFKLKNVSSKLVNITGVKASCGCTGSAASKLVVPAGEESTIDVRFDPTGRNGVEVKTITVTTDDPEFKEYQIIITSQVLKTVTIEPVALNFGQLPPHRGGKQTFTVTSRNTGFEIKSADITGLNKEVFTLEQIGKETVDLDGSPAVRYKYQISLSDKAPIGYINGMVAIATNIANTKVANASVSINGEVVGGLILNPPQMYVRMAIPNEPIVGEVQIQARDPNVPFKILSAELEGVPVEMRAVLDMKPREPGKKSAYRLIMSGLSPATPQLIKGTLRVKTNVKDMEDLKFPISGWLQQVTPAQPTPTAVPAPKPAPATKELGPVDGSFKGASPKHD